MRSILTALQEGRLFELPEAGKARALEFLSPDFLMPIRTSKSAPTTIEEIQLREQECNTGIGMGVGVPHVRARREEGELFSAIGWSSRGIDYDALRCEAVHLVVMYYIPGAQKNVYLKEVSSLVKAIRKSGGMDPIAHAPDLNAVRNLLLDWVSAGLGECRTGSGRAHDQVGSEASADGASARPAGPSRTAKRGRPAAWARVLVLGIGCAPGAVLVLATGCDMDGVARKKKQRWRNASPAVFRLQWRDFS